MFSVVYSLILAPLLLMIGVYFRCIFITADSSVVLDTLIYLLLNLLIHVKVGGGPESAS